MKLESTQERLSAWLKALGRLDDGPIHWWFTGITHGLTPERGLEPLFRHENFSFGPYKKVSATRHESVMEDITFYRDLEEGKLLREFLNPYTEEKCRVSEVITNGIRNFFDVEGDSGFVADGQDFARPFEIDVTAVGNTIWMTRQYDWAFPNPLSPDQHTKAYSGSTIRMQMETTLQVDRSDLEDPENKSVRCHSSYEAVTPWFPWMHMGTRDGYLITRAMGTKLASYSELPQEVFEAAEERFPGCVTGKSDPPKGKDPWSDYLKLTMAAAE